MSLEDRLNTRINQTGPISVAEFMTLCLLDPRHGYYPTRDPIGAGADFITAPEVSQMFGELLGVWTAQVWSDWGQPDVLHLMEAGPGKGTMMGDMLKVLGRIPGVDNAVQVHLMEASAALMAVQAQTLGAYPQTAHWCDTISEVGAGPMVLMGNEFLDCLPVRQFVYRGGQWVERMVANGGKDGFLYVHSRHALAQPDVDRWLSHVSNPAENMLVEVRPAVDLLVDDLAARAKTGPVMALFIDYGSYPYEPGDTVQAVSRHEKVSPLQNPGEVDLTARVDFEGLALAAKRAGLAVSGPVTQGEFLQRLGLMTRASALAGANADARAKIARQVHRLTDDAEMGKLFKVIAVHSADLPAPPGFGK